MIRKRGTLSQIQPKHITRIVKNVGRKIIRNIRVIPTNCGVYMTDRCNFKCPGCRRNMIGILKYKEMNLKTIKRIVDMYPSINVFDIGGYGEPTLCEEFIEVIDFLKSKNKLVGITTNGTNCDKILSLSHKPNCISISLYGYNNETYEKNTGLPVFDKVMNNYKIMRAKFDNVGFSYIIKRTNYQDLDNIIPLCDILKPNFLLMNNYLVYNIELKNELEKTITVKDTDIIRYIDKISEGKEYTIRKPIYIDLGNLGYCCRSYNFHTNLDGSGNIGGCQRQVPPDTSFGNIFLDKDPFNSKKMQLLRKRMHKTGHAYEQCRYCFGNWLPIEV